MPAGGGFVFGPFELDLSGRRLTRHGERMTLTAKQFDVLVALVTRAGQVLSKNDLIEAAWQNVIVSDAGVEQAVSRLRHALDADHPNQYIETASRRGYCFVAPVSPLSARRSDDDLEAMLAPYRAFVDGRAALESLHLGDGPSARATFVELVARHPDEALFHVGLANASIQQFEATRADVEPDGEALRVAVTHSREACRLRPELSEAWATFGFVAGRTGARVDAIAALRRAVSMERGNWRHQLRLSEGSWGEERLGAALQTLALIDCPLARVLAATVHVAREAFADAEREIDAGRAAVVEAPGSAARFSPVALDWLKGLLCWLRGDAAGAFAAFDRERALEARGHMYSRECTANTWASIGACHLLGGDMDRAGTAFQEAIARIPRLPMALAGLELVSRGARSAKGSFGDRAASDAAMPVDEAVARAAILVSRDERSAAAELVLASLASAPSGNAGWRVPIEPLLGVRRHRTPWAGVLAVLRDRAR